MDELERLRLFANALSVQETGWGNKKTVGQNNVYNIKDFSGGGTRAYDRREGSNDNYRNFNTREEADAHLFDLLRRKYPTAYNAKTIEEFTEGLRAGGYATDPNHGKGIINIYNRMVGGKSPQVQVQAQPQQPQFDFTPFNAKYGDKIRMARQNGFDDETIMRTIQQDEQAEKTKIYVNSNIEGLKPQAEKEVAVRLARTGDPIDGVAYLSTLPGFKEEIEYAKSIGKSNQEILQVLVPGSIAGLNAYQKRRGTNVLTDVGDGVIDQLEGYALGARQMLTFDPARERQLLAEEEARRVDPNRIALQGTVGGVVGGMVPDVVASVGGAVLTGGTSLGATVAGRLALAGAGGAATGALNPITSQESRLGNAALGGALSVAGAGAVEGAIKFGPRMSEKVGQVFAKRDVPLDDDVRARALSERFAMDFGVPVSEQGKINEKWISQVGKNLSDEFDNLLDGNDFVMPETARQQLMDPNFRKNFSADILADIDQLLYETVNVKKMVRRQELGPDGSPIMEAGRKVLRDENGFPIREDYLQGKMVDVPETELDFRPKTAYQATPPRVVRQQKIGPDGNVETSPRNVYKRDLDGKVQRGPDFDVVDENNVPIATFRGKPIVDYVNQVPKYENVQRPGGMARQQVRDENGNVVMQPFQVPVRDAEGNKVMKPTLKFLQKSRTATEKKMTPKNEYVEMMVPQQVPRTSVVPLRDAHNLLKNVRSKAFNAGNADFVDAFARDQLVALAKIVDDAFYDGAKVRAIPDGVAFDPAKLKSSLEAINKKYAKYSVLKDVMVSTKNDANELGKINHWEKALSSKRYSERFITGKAPYQDVHDALKINNREVERMAANDKTISDMQNLARTGGFMLASPLVIGGAEVVGRTAKILNKATGNKYKGMDELLGGRAIELPDGTKKVVDLTSLTRAAKEQRDVNYERRAEPWTITGKSKDAGKSVKASAMNLETLANAPFVSPKIRAGKRLDDPTPEQKRKLDTYERVLKKSLKYARTPIISPDGEDE